MIRNLPDSAAFYFEKSEFLSRKIDGNHESAWLINNVLFLGMLYDQVGKRDLAIKYYNETLRFRDWNNSHTRALEFLKTPYKR
jgi:hypothetical protein